MSQLTDISVSNFTTILYSAEDNITQSSSNLTNTQTIGELSDEKTIIDIQEYGQKYLRKLTGTSNAGPLEVVVNLKPDDESHKAFIAAYDSGTTLYFWLIMHTPVGYGTGAPGDYVKFKGFIGSKTIANEFDAARTMTFSIAIDGAVSDLLSLA